LAAHQKGCFFELFWNAELQGRFEEAPNLAHSTSRAIGQAVSIYLAIGSCAVTAQDNRPGRATFAEMIAYARLAVRACEHLAPDADDVSEFESGRKDTRDIPAS
jgi:hypothetical protein